MILQKDSAPEQVKTYFSKILQLKRSGKEFPIDLDDVFNLVYNRRDAALRELRKNFIEGDDFNLLQNEKVVNSTNLQNGIKIDAELSSQCLEYFIARRVRSVFEVYRRVFHAAMYANQPKQISEQAPHKEGVIFPQKLGAIMIQGIYHNGAVYFQLNKLARYVGFPDGSGTGYAKRVGQGNTVSIPVPPNSKQKQYFINKAGFEQLLVLGRHDYSSVDVDTAYRDLWNITIDGKSAADLDFAYQYTHQQINDLLFEVSRIGQVKLQKRIGEIVRGGRV